MHYKQATRWGLLGVIGSTLALAEPPAAPANDAPPEWKWDFTVGSANAYRRWMEAPGDTLGWAIPANLGGRVIGDALWLAVNGPFNPINPITYPPVPTSTPFEIRSPKGLGMAASKANKIKLRILNLSPETDGWIYWSTAEHPDRRVGGAHFSMRPYAKEWQEVVCHIDGQWQRQFSWGFDPLSEWKGAIDQLFITPIMMGQMGDLFIDWIAVASGPPAPKPIHPDLLSDEVVPRITLPGITQQDIVNAMVGADKCMIFDTPWEGCNYPMFYDGHFGNYPATVSWNYADNSDTMAGIKWVNPEFADNVIRNFINVQGPDGSVAHGGPKTFRGMIGSMSAMPPFYDAAYDVARRTSDESFREEILQLMRRNVDWWLSSVKCDPATHLVTGQYEEVLSQEVRVIADPAYKPFTFAVMDINVGVVVGCHHIAQLAEELGRPDDAKKYAVLMRRQINAINQWMWDEKEGAYLTFNVQTHQREPGLKADMFEAFRLKIAPPERAEPLIVKMLDPALFNWGTVPLTTVAKTHPEYSDNPPEDNLQGQVAWHGCIWTMRNTTVIRALEDIGRHDLAGDLAWSTIKNFNGRFYDFLLPNGALSKKGLCRYFVTTSLNYMEAIIDHVFGVDYDRQRKRLRILPRLPNDLADKNLAIHGLILPDAQRNTRLDLTISSVRDRSRTIGLKILGDLPDGCIEVLQPVASGQPVPRVTDLDNGSKLPVISDPSGLQSVAGVQVGMRRELNLRFDR